MVAGSMLGAKRMTSSPPGWPETQSGRGCPPLLLLALSTASRRVHLPSVLVLSPASLTMIGTTVAVGVAVGGGPVFVLVAVGVDVGVWVLVPVIVGVLVGVDVGVLVGVDVGEDVAVMVAVLDGVGEPSASMITVTGAETESP